MSDPQETTTQARRGSGGRNERIEIIDPRTIDQKSEAAPAFKLGADGSVQAPSNEVRGAVPGAGAPPVEKRYRYIGDARQVSMPPADGVAGYRFTIRPGKEISSLQYDLKHLQAQGISAKKPNPKLQRIDADGEDIEDE